jgi:predicted ATP-grasp superfamily ATP-dependent carboligase
MTVAVAAVLIDVLAVVAHCCHRRCCSNRRMIIKHTAACGGWCFHDVPRKDLSFGVNAPLLTEFAKTTSNPMQNREACRLTTEILVCWLQTHAFCGGGAKCQCICGAKRRLSPT